MVVPFKKTAAQGELGFIRLKSHKIPSNAKRVQPEGVYLIIGHSETGHHHVMDEGDVELYQLPDDLLECLLIVHKPTELRHLRDYDTHTSLLFEPGAYRVRHLREYTPEGLRAVQD